MIEFLPAPLELVLLLIIIASLLLALSILLRFHKTSTRYSKRRERKLRKTMLELRAKEKQAVQQAQELENTKIALLNMMEDLSESYEKLKELDKLKTDFVTNVSHELRTPLTTISLAFDLLEKEEDTQTREDILEMLCRNVVRLRRTVDNILDFSAIEAGKVILAKKPFDLRKTILSSVEDERPKLLAKGLLLRLEIPRVLKAVGDEEWTSRVLLNLIENSLKFTDRGTLTITAKRQKDYIRVSVKDSGRGIRKTDMPKIFNKFTKFEKHIPGSGLGLWASRQAIEEQGGKMTIESKRGKGTKVSFTLPVEAKND